jgi:hypothetical protein
VTSRRVWQPFSNMSVDELALTIVGGNRATLWDDEGRAYGGQSGRLQPPTEESPGDLLEGAQKGLLAPLDQRRMREAPPPATTLPAIPEKNPPTRPQQSSSSRRASIAQPNQSAHGRCDDLEGRPTKARSTARSMGQAAASSTTGNFSRRCATRELTSTPLALMSG